MFSVEGQDSWNIFKQDLSNHIPFSQVAKIRAVGCKFGTATPFNQYVGLSDFAVYSQDGRTALNVNFPFQLIFEPTLRDQYPDEFQADFPEILKKIPAGTLLFKVYAVKYPRASKVHIGNLVMTSKFIESEYGDKYLFFRH